MTTEDYTQKQEERQQLFNGDLCQTAYGKELRSKITVGELADQK